MSKPFQPGKQTKKGPPTTLVIEFIRDEGNLSANQPGVSYLVPVGDIDETFLINKRPAKIKPDPVLMLNVFKAFGDFSRLPGAEIRVTR